MVEVLGSHYLGGWKVRVTSIIKEPVNVNGLLALLTLEDGACLLLAGQGGRVHCWGKRVLVSAKGTTSHRLKASLLPGSSPAPHQCLKPPPCLQNHPQRSGWSQAKTNVPVPGAALLPVPFLGCSAASNVGLTEEGGEEQGQHSSSSLSPSPLIPAQERCPTRTVSFVWGHGAGWHIPQLCASLAVQNPLPCACSTWETFSPSFIRIKHTPYLKSKASLEGGRRRQLMGGGTVSPAGPWACGCCCQ